MIGKRAGPTTKADCLNALWRAMRRDEAARAAMRAVVLHDAEDVVHPGELACIDTLIDEHAVVQLPVLPLITAAARSWSGHYADEFAEAHGKHAGRARRDRRGLPLAGVGCAIARRLLERDRRGARRRRRSTRPA